MKTIFLIASLLFVGAFAEDDHGEAATTFTEESFKKDVEEKAHFVMFYAPW